MPENPHFAMQSQHIIKKIVNFAVAKATELSETLTQR